MVDLICKGLLESRENYKMKNSLSQWDSNRVSSAYEATVLTITSKIFVKSTFLVAFLCVFMFSIGC